MRSCGRSARARSRSSGSIRIRAGRDLELTWNGSVLALSVDGRPTDAGAAAALERLAAARERGSYAAHAHRLVDDLWEVLVLPL